MTWDHEFAVLRKLNEEQGYIRAGVDQSAPDRENIEQHIKNKVMPLFKDVAEAARNNGYYGTAEFIVVQPVSGAEETHASFVMGAHLALSRNRRAWSPQCEGSLRIVHASSTIFTLNRRAPDFNITDGASLSDLSRFNLIVMVREIVASTFK